MYTNACGWQLVGGERLWDHFLGGEPCTHKRSSLVKGEKQFPLCVLCGRCGCYLSEMVRMKMCD